MENDRALGDSQITEELATNERIVEYPKDSRTHAGIKVRFRFPTLQIQRKIDTAIRTKKKILRETVDKIDDPSSPNGYRVVPAYKSRQVLEKEFNELGWWTPEMEEQLEEFSNLYTANVTRLEILGFESYEDILEKLEETRTLILKEVDMPEEEKEKEELVEAVFQVTMPGVEHNSIFTNKIKAAATSTTVDDLLAKVEIYKDQFLAYSEMVKAYADLSTLEREKNALFVDSWQSQLDYHTKIMQVFYCTERVEDSKPLYASPEELENEEDTQFTNWLFTELTALWQGLSDEARERMGKYSFTYRAPSERPSSEELPDQPESKADGDTPSETQSTSTEASDTKDNLPLFK